MHQDRTKIEYIMVHKIVLGTLIFFFVFALAQPTLAQSNLATAIQIYPENVRADEPFSVSLSSSDVDLDRATISWYLNEKLGLSGVGKIGFSSKTGPVGTEFRVRAEIKTPSGRIITKKTVVRPQEIDLLWHAFSYTPPFYLGRSLAPSSGFVLITAMPNMVDADGNFLDPKELVYTWSDRGIVLGSASGYGKQSIVLENAQIPERLLVIQVRVSSLNKTVGARESIQIPLTKPRILFYERLPLHGVMYRKILRNAVFDKDEMVIRAEPYFFSKDDVQNNKLLYKWKLNNSVLENISSEKNNEIAFRREGAVGSATISLEILNDNLPFRILQKAERSLNIDIR